MLRLLMRDMSNAAFRWFLFLVFACGNDFNPLFVIRAIPVYTVALVSPYANGRSKATVMRCKRPALASKSISKPQATGVPSGWNYVLHLRANLKRDIISFL
jgi:hypothetical protein